MSNQLDSIISQGAGKVSAAKARMNGLVGVFTLLCEQHGEVGNLLKRVKADPSKRADLWPKIRAELTSHEKAELRAVYPVLAENEATRGFAEQHASDAAQLTATIEHIDATNMDSSQWTQLFDQLIQMVEQHVLKEETEIFPKAQQVIGKARAREIEPHFVAAKKSAMLSISH